MKATINGINVEGTPDEIVQYIMRIQEQEKQRLKKFREYWTQQAMGLTVQNNGGFELNVMRPNGFMP